MKDILVVYPHGLGDCVLLTPTLREYYKKIGALLKNLISDLGYIL